MKLALTHLSVLALQLQRYLPVIVMFVSIAGMIFGFNPGDNDGGTGH